MLTNHIGLVQEDEGTPTRKRRSRAIVWDYFEKIIGDDGLPKSRCIRCRNVYNTTPSSGTSTLRRHLPKCFPQALIQHSPTETSPWTNIASCYDDPPKDSVVRAAKKSKLTMEDDLGAKTDRELQEFIWRTKRNIPLLDQRLPEKAILLKETLKCYESELARRAKLRLHKESSPHCGTSRAVVKIEMVDQHVARNEKVDENMAEDESAVEDETTQTHADVDQKSSQFGTGKVVVKVEMEDQSVAVNEKFDENMAEEENAGKLQVVPHEDGNQAFGKQTAISTSSKAMCDELRKVSSMLTMVTSAHSLYAPPPGYSLDEEAERAKQTLSELLKKDFESVVGTPDEQEVKSSIQILMKNLDKLPMVQGRVIEGLNVEFESACKNCTIWRDNVHANITFEVQEAENIRVLQEWQEKDRELESSIAEVDADILRLTAELRKKELTRDGLVKRKFHVFEQSKLSIAESKKLLQDMVSVKLQSDVALDNMKDLAAKWEKMRQNFQ